LSAEIISMILKSSFQLPVKGLLAMRTFMPNAGQPAYYSLREAAWVLGVEPAKIARAIRLGALHTVRRRDRLVVPASAIAELLADGVLRSGETP
jgi:hypothetical protein